MGVLYYLLNFPNVFEMMPSVYIAQLKMLWHRSKNCLENVSG
jgi:hypothetical protein